MYYGDLRSWTIATLVVAGIVIALFISYLAQLFGYAISAIYNMTSYVHEEALRALNRSPSEVVTGTSGDYSYELTVPSNGVLANMARGILVFAYGLATVFGDAQLLALALAITLIIIALEMRVR